MAAHAHVGRAAIVTKTGFGDHAVHRRRSGSDAAARLGSLLAGGHRRLQQRETLANDVGRRPQYDGAADLRELVVVDRRDLGQHDVAALDDAAPRRAHRLIVLGGAHQEEIVGRP